MARGQNVRKKEITYFFHRDCPLMGNGRCLWYLLGTLKDCGWFWILYWG